MIPTSVTTTLSAGAHTDTYARAHTQTFKSGERCIHTGGELAEVVGVGVPGFEFRAIR